MSLSKHEKKDKIKWVITFTSIFLLAVLFVGVIFGISNQRTTTELNFSSYHIGSISDGGAIIDSKQNIYSDMVTTEGMEIKVSEDSQVTYKVFFYDADNKFVSASDSLSTDFNGTVPSGAEQFRVLITPNLVDGENVQVTVFNMNRYSNMINVTVAK